MVTWDSRFLTASAGFVEVDSEYARPGARLFTSQRAWASPNSAFGLLSRCFYVVLEMMSGMMPFKQRNDASSRLRMSLSGWSKIPLPGVFFC